MHDDDRKRTDSLGVGLWLLPHASASSTQFLDRDRPNATLCKPQNGPAYNIVSMIGVACFFARKSDSPQVASDSTRICKWRRRLSSSLAGIPLTNVFAIQHAPFRMGEAHTLRSTIVSLNTGQYERPQPNMATMALNRDITARQGTERQR